MRTQLASIGFGIVWRCISARKSYCRPVFPPILVQWILWNASEDFRTFLRFPDVVKFFDRENRRNLDEGKLPRLDYLQLNLRLWNNDKIPTRFLLAKHSNASMFFNALYWVFSWRQAPEPVKYIKLRLYVNDANHSSLVSYEAIRNALPQDWSAQIASDDVNPRDACRCLLCTLTHRDRC